MLEPKESGADGLERPGDGHLEPLVSFVTPVYNGARYIAECIESVLGQEYENWEYVILDNCSSDGTNTIIERYARKDSRIRVYRNETVLPIMANWNAALHRIDPESEYCKVVHADDRLFPRCTRAMVEVAERHPSVGLVGAYSLWGNRVACDRLPWPADFVDGRELSRTTLLGHIYPFLSPSSLLIRSTIIRGSRQFYPGPDLYADVAACYEVLRSFDFSFVHEVLTFIRRHDDSVTEKEARPFRRTLMSNLALLTKYGPLFLEEEEYQGRLAALRERHLSFLARSVLERPTREFWHFHFDGLKDLGFPMTRLRLTRAVLGLFVEHPLASLKRLLRIRYPSRNRHSGYLVD